MQRHLWLILLVGTSSFARVPRVPDLKTEESAPPLRSESEENRPKGVSHDFANFGIELVNRIDRIVKKKSFEMFGDPWTVQGLPLIFNSADTGFHLGLRLMLNNIRRQDPHKMEFEGQILASNKAHYLHFLRFDHPRAFGGNYRLMSRVRYDREINLRYFGIGNNISVNRRLIDSGRFYENTRTGPSFSVQLLRDLGRNFKLGPTLGLKWTEIQYLSGSLMERERPLGIEGGNTHYVGLAALYDTRDFEPYPSTGYSHELYFNYHGKPVGSSYDVLRWTYTFTKYVPLHRTLTFAHRTLVEWLMGDVPFFELGAVGGSNGTTAMGGDRFLRGYEGNEYIDRFRMIFGFELRWDPLRVSISRQEFTLGFVPFLDLGRVWPAPSFDFAEFHASTGWGARIIWNNRFVLRADVALNNIGTSWHVNFGNSF